MKEELNAALGTLETYAALIVSGVGFLLGAMLVVFVLYRLLTSLIKPKGKVARIVQVGFGAVYVMVILIAVMLAAERSGYNVAGFSGIAILAVIVGAVLVFFALPFLPRLPFAVGDLVSIRGTTGTVDGMTTTQTVLRTFDGRLVFIPNVTMLGADVENYSTVPVRRVELNLEIRVTDDIETGRQLILEAMASDARVLDEPAPAVFVTAMDKGLVSLLGLCWVINADWFSTRDALIVDVARRLVNTDGVTPVVPELTVRQVHES